MPRGNAGATIGKGKSSATRPAQWSSSYLSAQPERILLAIQENDPALRSPAREDEPRQDPGPVPGTGSLSPDTI